MIQNDSTIIKRQLPDALGLLSLLLVLQLEICCIVLLTMKILNCNLISMSRYI